MIYPNSFDHKTGFFKIKELLQRSCSSAFGEKLAAEVTFLTDHLEINRLLRITNEFIIIQNEEDNFPMDPMVDVSYELSRIKPQGTWIDEAAFAGLLKSLLASERLIKFFKAKHEDYPECHSLAHEVPGFTTLIKEIRQVFDQNGEIKDHASPELKKIRVQLSKIHSTISSQIDRMVKSAKAKGLISSDTQPAIRDGRLVIPVESRLKRKINGIVHDESATGKTAFIEPAEVVEAHNKIKALHHEEKREIVKILVTLTNSVRPMVPEILEGFDFLAFVDFNRAKAKLAREINALCPTVKDNTIIRWKNAVHPILFLNHKKENKSVVPLNITLNSENRILLISGPNAGGKSVCLKTVSLLQYMVQCGLPIPVDESSELGIFDKIFLDIGDEQSIDNDLSTYSSHLLNMKHFLKFANNKTLLLVDEFGTGTEPKLGGAIAESILGQLNERGSFGVINTHYGNLKHFASETDGIINGAMLFDLQKMQPEYKLQIGKPGSSYAIEIARKIGLPDDVIKIASDKIGDDHFKYDKHLREITRDKKYWENKRNNIRIKDKQLTRTIETLESEKEALIKQRKEILQKAKLEAEQIYKDANASIEKTIRSIKENQAEKHATRKAREKLEAQKEAVDKRAEKEMKISKKAYQLIKQQERKKPTPKKQKQHFDKSSIEVGDAVRLEGQKGNGEVISIKGKEAEVAFGQLRSKIKLIKLEKVSNKQIKREQTVNISNPMLTQSFKNKKLNFKSEIDLRGQRADEAMQSITLFLDEALMVGSKQVRILHGTGTGALRQITRQYLATLSYVDSFNDERIDMGGAGITVVNLDF